MKPLSRFLLLTLVVHLQRGLFPQTFHWESMDGDRLFIGSNSGTHRTTDGGTNWIRLSPPPLPASNSLAQIYPNPFNCPQAGDFVDGRRLLLASFNF